MRDEILYLANRWTEFEMLLTSNRFLDLIRFLLQSFPPIPQFIAQFRPIYALSFLILFPIEMRAPAEQQESKKGRMGEKSFPCKSRVASKIRAFLKVCKNGHLEL